MARVTRFFLGLGSNIGDRRENLRRARALLRKAGICIRRASSLYRTQPVGYARQRWFYNQVLEVEAPLSPFELLDAVKAVEKAMGRQPTVPNGPRNIDVDILLAGRTVILTRELVIPHPRLARRNFVLVPLKEIAPREVHPLLHKDVTALEAASRDRSVVRRLKPGRTGPSSSRPRRRGVRK